MNGYAIQLSTAFQDLVFLMVSSADHITGLTGATPTVRLRKQAGTFAAPAGAVSEIASGWYRVAGNATDSNTLGPLCLNATAAGADPTDMLYMVVAYNPLSAVNLGLSALPNAAANTPNGLGICDNTLAVPAFVQAYAFNQDPWTLTWYGLVPAAGFPANSAGQALVSAGAAGNPWMAPLPGTYTSGQAGYILATLSTQVATVATTVASPVTVGNYTTGQDPATRVLNAVAAGFSNPGSVGAAILAAGGAGDPWSTVLPGGYAAGTAGNIIGSRLDAAVSSRSTFAGGAVASVTGSVASVAAPVIVGSYSTGQDPRTQVLSATASMYSTPGSVGAAILAAGSAGDPWATMIPGAYAAGTAGNILGTQLDAAISSRSTFAGGPVASVAGSVGSVLAPVGIDLTIVVPRSNAAETVGDCLMGARAQGLGAWTLNTTTTPPQLTLYAADNATPIRTFSLDSATAPTMRY